MHSAFVSVQPSKLRKMSWTKVLVLCTATVCLLNRIHAQSLSLEEASKKQMTDCITEADFECVKLRTLANIYDLLRARSLDVVEGVQVEYTGDQDMDSSTARDLVNKDWGNLLFDFAPKLLKDLSLKINAFPGGNVVVSKSLKENGLVTMSVEEEERGVVEGRGDEKKKMAFSFLMFGAMYTVLVTLGLVLAKFLAFKGILVGKVALVVAAVDGLLRLFNHKPVQGHGYYHIDTYDTAYEKGHYAAKGPWGTPTVLH